MKMRMRQDNNVVLLYPEGIIDINSASLIETTGKLIAEGHSKIICNLKKVDLIDYNGLSIITIAYKNIVNKGGAMKLCNVPLHVRELLKMVRLDLAFEIYDTEDIAIKAFQNTSKIDKLYLRRRFERLDFCHPVEFTSTPADKSKKFSGKILNISGEGVFIYTKHTFPVSTKLHLELALDGKKLNLAGIAIWLADKDIQPHCYPGMGINFVKMEQKKQKEIIDFINRNVTNRSGA